MKPRPRTKPRPASKSDIAQIKKLIDTNSFAVISKKLQIPYKEVQRIITELKLI